MLKKKSSAIIEDNYMGLNDYQRKASHSFHSLLPPEEEGEIPQVTLYKELDLDELP